jgi:hypothetical protein
VVVLKAGKTAEGSRAVSSHTSLLAGDYKVFSDVLAQHGIVEARNEFELTCFCESLSHYPRGIEGKVGVITVSGGHGALATDICADLGLRVPPLSEAVKQEIRAGLSPNVCNIASLENPVDLTGSAVDEDFVAAVNVLSRAPEVDCVLLLLLPYSPGISSDLGARLSYVHQQNGKPLVPMCRTWKNTGSDRGLQVNRVRWPPPSTARSSWWKPCGGAGHADCRDDGHHRGRPQDGWVLEPEALRLLETAGVAVPRFAWAAPGRRRRRRRDDRLSVVAKWYRRRSCTSPRSRG